MIIQVIVDMKTFLFVLLVVICAFASAFQAISKASPDDDFIDGNFFMAVLYSYRMSLGDFDTDSLGTSVQPLTSYLLFILCTILSLVVMFNLLIAIISETFA